MDENDFSGVKSNSEHIDRIIIQDEKHTKKISHKDDHKRGGGVTLMVSLTAKYPFFLESPNTQYTSGKSGCKLLTLFDNDSDDGVSAVMVLQFWTAVVVPELSVAC